MLSLIEKKEPNVHELLEAIKSLTKEEGQEVISQIYYNLENSDKHRIKKKVIKALRMGKQQL